MLFLFAALLLVLFIYSYALIDPNLTLTSASWWVFFRDPLVFFGYYLRNYSIISYILIISFLYLFHWYFIVHYKKYSIWKLVILVVGILVAAYPLLSHDLFNYIFYAKIVTFYGDNPYVQIPGNYYLDEWLRFMHWTHVPYPYGPVFLPLTLIPSFLAFGKFVLNYLFFKAMFVGFYVFGIYVLQKTNKKNAMIFATHPLILIEGVVNTHNDLIGVVLALWGIYLLKNSKNVIARIILLLSVGIKYLTAPVLFLKKEKGLWNYFIIISQLILVVYLGYTREFHPWYFLTFFAYLPLFPKVITYFWIFSFSLLISYYPFIQSGNWGQLYLKYWIMGLGLAVNVAYLLIKKLYLKK